MSLPKFRAWDKEDKRMSYGEIEYYDDSFGVRFDHFCVGADFEVEFMQSTGLKDKKGVEIFEGDIVRLAGAYEDFKTGIVEFWKGAFVVNYESVNADFNYFDDISLPIEIIGDIYQNPELLKGE